LSQTKATILKQRCIQFDLFSQIIIYLSEHGTPFRFSLTPDLAAVSGIIWLGLAGEGVRNFMEKTRQRQIHGKEDQFLSNHIQP